MPSNHVFKKLNAI